MSQTSSDNFKHNSNHANKEKLEKSGAESLWRIEMFGSLRLLPPGVDSAAAITHFPARKAGALLSYLAFYGQIHQGAGPARDVLADALWPDSDTEKSRNNLRVTLNRLRKTLSDQGHDPDDLIVADNHNIGLKMRRSISDVVLFEQNLKAAAGAGTLASRSLFLCEAVDLYSGELLRDYDESWITPEARRLEGLFFDAVRDLVSLLEEENEPERALRYAYHAANIDPLRPDVHYDLLRLYIAQGQHEAARLHYERFSKALRKDFKRTPPPAMRTLMAPLLKPQTKITENSASSVSARTVRGAPVPLRPLENHTNNHSKSHSNGHSKTAGKNRFALWSGGSITFLLIDNLHFDNLHSPSDSRLLNEENADASCRAQLRDLVVRHGGHEFGALRAGSIWAIFRTACDALLCASTLRHLSHQNPQFHAYCGACRIALDSSDSGLWATMDSPQKSQSRATTAPMELIESGIKRAALDRALSVLQTGHPGQTLCSEVTGALLRRDLARNTTLDDMGIYRLQNVPVPERIYQVSYADLAPRTFPALLAAPLHSGELPASWTTFFGREDELRKIENFLTPPKTNAALPKVALPKSVRKFVTQKVVTQKVVTPSAAPVTRLVTLTGFGGCGKTRLALEAARRLRETYRRAVWFVPLSGVREPHLIIHALVNVLRLPGAPGLDPWLQVVSELSQRPSLLVLDNFEQLHEGGVEILKRLLEMTPSLRCLVTSRQSLGIEGEQPVLVAPLPAPPLREARPGRPFSPSETRRRHQQITNSDSVKLFVDRARCARPTFELTPTCVESVVQLCNLLDGIPLAIELVASHAQGLTPQQILSLFGRNVLQKNEVSQKSEANGASENVSENVPESDGFDYLGYFRDPRPETTDRQRSLRAVIQWSYELLAPELCQFFERLWVFRGGWTVEAAQFVAAAGDGASNDASIMTGKGFVQLSAEAANLHGAANEPFADDLFTGEAFTGVAFENLLRLQDHSLIAAEEQGAEIRFSMLSMLRSFAMEQLGETPCAALEARHAAYYIGLAERASAELMSAKRDQWLCQLDPEIDNLRAALSWSLRHAPAQCVQMAGALWRYWEARGLFAEGRDWLGRALDAISRAETPVENFAAYRVEKPKKSFGKKSRASACFGAPTCPFGAFASLFAGA